MEPIKRNALSNGQVIDAAIPEHCNEYSYRIRYFYDNFVVKESAPNLLKKLSASYLKKHLQSKERLHREIQKLIAVISTQDIKRREISVMQSTPDIFI